MKRFYRARLLLAAAGALFSATAMAEEKSAPYRLITLDPGHFHAALVQKSSYANVDNRVSVYAPDSNDVDLHLKRIHGFNERSDSPTAWKTQVYRGADFLQKMLAEKPGNIVVLSGNNSKKTDYILQSLQAGLNVYADKPMATNTRQFEQLKKSIALARENNLALLDIMTERFEISTLLQKELSQIPEVFGELAIGTPDEPAITKESVHHYFKYVAGKPLQRPAWFFDDKQEGDGLVDVTTHLVDLVQWECFPNEIINYEKEIQVDSASRWPTKMSMQQFRNVTGQKTLPDYLKNNVHKDTLHVYSNGEINYRIRGVHAKVKVSWQYQAPEGAGDTHFSIMRGTQAQLVIRQGKEQNYKPELYIEPVSDNAESAGKALTKDTVLAALAGLNERYPGLTLSDEPVGWKVNIPNKFRVGHEAHFAQVTKAYLSYLESGEIPNWEWPNILAKYYVTTKALDIAITETR